MTKHINPAIFRAYDIRGTVPDLLNPDAALQIGRAYATQAISIGANKIVVGRDGRISSPELAAALIDGIIEAGLDVIDVGMLPTPSVYWAALRLAGGNCAIVTGSHNPREYNGIKMMLGGQAMAGKDIQSLLLLISEQRYTKRGVAGVCERKAVMDDYAEQLLAGRRLSRPVKVVIDCGNGVMGPYAPKILRQLGCEVHELFCEPDGNFPNHHPDPAMPANWMAATNALEEYGAEMALAFDGDGDRLGMWLPKSGIIFPDRLLMLLAREQLHRQPGAIVVYDVKCSKHVAAFVAEHGGKPHLCRTGHSFIKREMARTGASLGGELSGHFFFNEGDWSFDDALLAAIKLLELVSEHPDAEQLCAQAPDSHASPEYTVSMPDGESPHEFVAGLGNPELYPGHQALIEIDGVRAEWHDGFGLVRASNTTPSLIMRFEGNDADACSRIKKVFRDCISRANPELQLPF